MRKVLKYAGVASSTWYNQLHKQKEDKRKNNRGRPIPGYCFSTNGGIICDTEIAATLKKYRETKEFLNGGGCKKLSHYIRNDYGYIVNKKKIYRICKEHKLLLSKKKKSRRRKSNISVNRTITKPNQLWELDLKYGYVHGENRFFFLLAIIDVYLRFIVNYHIGLRCTGKDLVFTLNTALRKHAINKDGKLVIRSDNGTQMTSKVFMDFFNNYTEQEVIQEFIPTATPNKNAHIEAFNSILEIEFFQPRYFCNYSQAYSESVDFINFYNTKRIHGSLGYITPVKAKNLIFNGEEVKIKAIKV